MTRALAGPELGERISVALPGAVAELNDTEVCIEPEALLPVARFLRDEPGLDFSAVRSISAVDYIEHFEVVYHLLSMRLNRSAILKMRCHGRGEIVVPSVVEVWRGAELQEREIWDLMGIRFEGHPNMRRVLLWEGFDGHPLRKDFLS